MSKIPKSLIDEYYRVFKKYWNTADSDYIEKYQKIAHDIERYTNKDWLIWSNLLQALCRLNVSLNCVYGILETIGFEVEDE